MRPSEVLDCKTDLVERFGLPNFRSFLEISWFGLLEDSNSAPTEVPREVQAALVEGMRGAATYGAAYHVTADMCAMVKHAAEQLPDLDRYDTTLAPTDAGLVRFDEPLTFDIEAGAEDKYPETSRKVLIHWVLWAPLPPAVHGRRGIIFWLFNDVYDQPDSIYLGAIQATKEKDKQLIARDIGRWCWSGTYSIIDDQRIGPAYQPEGKTGSFQYTMDDQVNVGRFMHALYLMLNQTITQVVDAPIERHAAKRARRMKIPDRVSVIQLRRSEHRPTEGESVVEWSHRWIVRGHWRMQPYGEGRKEVRRIWIPPHIKGPDNKPLVITEKVYDLMR